MTRPVEAKYCPRCGAINARMSETCIHCGRQFQSELPSPLASTALSAPLSEEDLHRTQMFMLPLPVVRTELSDTGDVSHSSDVRLGRLRELLTDVGRSPILLAAAVLLVAAIITLLGLGAALGDFPK